VINDTVDVHEQILGSSVDRQTLGHEAMLLLTLLIQYRKYEVGFLTPS